MEDLGQTIELDALEAGIAVYDRRGQRVGILEDVVIDPAEDVAGLVVAVVAESDRELYADASRIAEVRQRGVVLAVEGDELPARGRRPAAAT